MKVALGLSGGVDSAVAALRLQEMGHTVEGVWLDLGFGDPEPARRTAEQLGIGFTVYDAAEAHETLVRSPFALAYRQGLTPNPCVRCNPTVKLPALLRAAEQLGAEKLATGHYAATAYRNGRPCLRQSGGDKDQSYMLAMVGPELLDKILFPLEGLTKPEIRAIARSRGFVSADAPDSQDICFIPDGDYGLWLEQRGMGLPPGDFADESGRILGRHRGLHRYTIGQRRGLGVSAASRLYVCALERDTNRVILGTEERLLCSTVRVNEVLWGAMEPQQESFSCQVKLRSRPQKLPAQVLPSPEGLTLRFDAPLRRPAPGQLAVGYDESGFVLFGGTILP